jgi:hypothetical protein
MRLARDFKTLFSRKMRLFRAGTAAAESSHAGVTSHKWVTGVS